MCAYFVGGLSGFGGFGGRDTGMSLGGPVEACILKNCRRSESRSSSSLKRFFSSSSRKYNRSPLSKAAQHRRASQHSASDLTCIELQNWNFNLMHLQRHLRSPTSSPKEPSRLAPLCILDLRSA